MAKSLSRRALVHLTSASAITLALVGGVQAGELALGPVQQVNVRTSTLVVLGQTFHVGPTALITSQASYPAHITLSGVIPGSLVLVDGTETASGKALVQNVIALSGLNSPGATQLYVAGVVSNVNNTGQVRIGKLIVDVNQTLNSDGSLPANHSFVSVIGTQPTANGVFLATSVARTNGIGGTGSNGIGGTGSNGIGGTGSNGIGGTGSNGIGGTGGTGSTGSNGIGGTGSNGIGGTGSNGIGGTGSNGIGGTGSNGIGGTGSNGIGGTGSLGIGGTGSNGIGGTGSLGIGGTGSNGIGGTGSLGIGGTGSNGIGGTGSLGIGGTGSNGIGGTGSLGIGGTGSNGIGGTGSL